MIICPTRSYGKYVRSNKRRINSLLQTKTNDQNNVRVGLEKNKFLKQKKKIIATIYNNNKLIEKRETLTTLTQELHDMILKNGDVPTKVLVSQQQPVLLVNFST